MPDISKCSNEECKQKDKCYRYTCEADEYQTYAEFSGKEDCEGFITK